MARTIGLNAKLFLAANARRARLQPAAEPNVIPFIDVLLVLLIIFMVTAPKPDVDIQVDLPTGYVAPPEGLKPTLVELRPGAGGLVITIDGAPARFDTLAAQALDRALANNPALDVEDIYAQARIYVRADQSIAYGDLVAAMDALKVAGFAKVGVFAETADG